MPLAWHAAILKLGTTTVTYDMSPCGHDARSDMAPRQRLLLLLLLRLASTSSTVASPTRIRIQLPHLTVEISPSGNK